MVRALFLRFLLGGMCLTCQAQMRTAHYFPLAVRNEWTFIEVLAPPFLPPDTLWFGPYSIVSTTVVNDTSYYEFDRFPALATRFRDDGDGRVRARVGDRDQLLFDFSRGPTDPFLLDLGPGPVREYRVSNEWGPPVSVPAGVFSDVVTVTVEPVEQAIDASYSFVFAAGVGLVRYWYGLGSNGSLFQARVGGAVISGVADEPLPSTPAVRPHPNPFSSSSVFSFARRAGGHIQVRVFNSQGRLVDTLEADRCSVVSCSFSWAPVGVANGVYIIAANTGAGSQLVILRK